LRGKARAGDRSGKETGWTEIARIKTRRKEECGMMNEMLKDE
jgi:hypothetical protein